MKVSWYNRRMKAKAIIVANWKMHPQTAREALQLFAATKKAVEKTKSITLVVAPPAIFLRDVSKGHRGRIAFAVQSARAEEEGAFTGSISMAQAKDARASYAIAGHAERRVAGESDADARTQVAAALALGMTPILCVGEKERGHDGAYFRLVRAQLRAALEGVKPAHIKKIIIAYEPVWAIGAPAPMSPRDMHEMAIFIRKSVVELFGQAAMDIRILYGGAIDDTTASAMMREGDVAGLLVGRASADAKECAALLGILA